MILTSWRLRLLSFLRFGLKTSQGLLFHPFQTTFSLVSQKKNRLWIFLPAIYFLLLTFVWRFWLRSFALFFLRANCILMLVKTSLLFFFLYWQLSLFYLFFKILFSLQKGNQCQPH